VLSTSLGGASPSPTATGLYGALIIASAGGRLRYPVPEDLHNGQVIDGRLTIRNPFQPLGA
jgi:hypothetical protein